MTSYTEAIERAIAALFAEFDTAYPYRSGMETILFELVEQVRTEALAEFNCKNVQFINGEFSAQARLRSVVERLGNLDSLYGPKDGNELYHELRAALALATEKASDD